MASVPNGRLPDLVRNAGPPSMRSPETCALARAGHDNTEQMMARANGSGDRLDMKGSPFHASVDPIHLPTARPNGRNDTGHILSLSRGCCAAPPDPRSLA